MLRKQLIQELNNVDEKDDNQFHFLLLKTINILNLSDKDMARKFGVCRPSIKRWKNGISAPHPAMRRPIYKYFIEQLLNNELQTT